MSKRLNETAIPAKASSGRGSLSRNKRGIAGSLIWINFDRHALLNLVWSLGGTFIANVDDVRPQFQTDANAYVSQNAIFQNTLANIGTQVQEDNTPLTSVSGMKTEAMPWYSDQILPFDITLAGTNENGAATAMKIFGVEILNEGSGVSIDDAVTKMSRKFACFDVEPWQDLVVRGGKKNQSRAGEAGAGVPTSTPDLGRNHVFLENDY